MPFLPPWSSCSLRHAWEYEFPLFSFFFFSFCHFKNEVSGFCCHFIDLISHIWKSLLLECSFTLFALCSLNIEATVFPCCPCHVHALVLQCWSFPFRQLNVAGCYPQLQSVSLDSLPKGSMGSKWLQLIQRREKKLLWKGFRDAG